MANLEGMPIGSLPEATSIQDGDEIVVYRPSTGKAYQANTDLIDSLDTYSVSQPEIDGVTIGTWNCTINRVGRVVTFTMNASFSEFPSSEVTLFQIPSGYRPVTSIQHSYVTQNNTIAKFAIATSGDVNLQVMSGTSVAWLARQQMSWITNR